MKSEFSSYTPSIPIGGLFWNFLVSYKRYGTFVWNRIVPRCPSCVTPVILPSWQVKLVHQFPELVKCTRHPPHAYKQPVWTRYSTGATQCSLLGLMCLLMHQMQKRDGRGRTCGGAGHVSLIRRVPVSASERWCKQTKMYMKLCGKHEVVVTLVQSNLLQK
jgi:hypothetical protein